MQINFLNKQNIFSTKLNYQNNIQDLRFNSVNSDVFVKRSMSFTGKSSVKRDFIELFKTLGKSEKDFLNACLKSTKLGSGQEGSVYRIPFKNFKKYVLKVIEGFDFSSVEPIEKMTDDFPDNNFGQPIAKLGEKVLILRKLEGKTLSSLIPESPSYSHNLEQKTVDYYKMMASMPQESFDDYVKDITTLNKKNRSLDPNSGNIILKDKKFQITDTFNRSYNFLGDVLFPFFPDSRREINFSNDETEEYKKAILRKLFTAAKKNNIFHGMNDQVFWLLYHSQEGSVAEELKKLLQDYLK